MGLFVTVDGPNGVGKTTFIKNLAVKLEESFKVYTTKEPTETNLGRWVKSNTENLYGRAYAHMIAADRCYHVDNYIIPNKDKYDVIICDRYIESSLVLQFHEGVEKDYIWKLNSEFPIPDISVMLTAQEAVLDYRLSQRENLSSFEIRLSRKEEIKLYNNAALYLKTKDYNHIVFDNDDKNFDNNLAVAYDEIIKSLMKDDR